MQRSIHRIDIDDEGQVCLLILLAASTCAASWELWSPAYVAALQSQSIAGGNGGGEARQVHLVTGGNASDELH